MAKKAAVGFAPIRGRSKKKKTSIGSSHNTKCSHKKGANYKKPYRGQGRK